MGNLGVTSFDELNALVGYKRSTPYNEYFGEMDLSKEQIQDRIDLAEMLEDEFEEVFAGMFYSYPQVSSSWIDDVKDRYLSTLEAVGLITALGNVSKPQERQFYSHADKLAADTIAATVAKPDALYSYSEDRARFIAENEANIAYATDDFWVAVAEGATEKTWITCGDNHVRDSHMEVDGVTIPIEEPFYVGGSELMFPGDDSFGAGAEELVNCRCSISYDGDQGSPEMIAEGESPIDNKTFGALSGAYNDENDPKYENRERIAEENYTEIRNRKSQYEIRAVAQNSGFSTDQIERVYEHVFIREHLFEDGRIKRFDPDYYMAHSWMRLREGKNIQKHDIIMIRHELAEEKIMGKGLEIPYETAHNEVEKTWSYKAALLEYLKDHDV